MVLEIGCGMGEATAAMAAADPAGTIWASKCTRPASANLLALLAAAGLTNVRVAHGDRDPAAGPDPPAALDTMHIFSPIRGPRRATTSAASIQPARRALLRDRLGPAGVLHCATDWAEYAERDARDVLEAAPGLENVHSGFAPRPPHRPDTRFEQRGPRGRAGLLRSPCSGGSPETRGSA